MLRSRTAIVGLTALAGLLAAIPGVALAADLPPGVVTHGMVSVVVTDPDASIEGHVVDRTGGPFPVARAEAIVTVDGSAPVAQVVTVGIDGAFSILLDPAALTTDTVVAFTAESPILTEPGDPGCDLQVIERASATWQVPAGTSLPAQTVVSERVVLAATCGTVGTPAPPAAPSITLPPTDRSMGSSSGEASPAGFLAALLGMALVAAGVTTLLRSRRD